jgi:diguanylate cyclase (GGDEF)-like protein
MKTKDTILVVDDERINVSFLVSNLEHLYDIKVAPNGKVALKILDKFDIDLVLLDIQMPVLDGYETAKAIKSDIRLQDIPIIFLTGKADSESIVKGFELGAKDYVTKPFNTKELQVRVQNHLQTYHLINKLETAYKNLERFIETQDNIVLLTDSKEMKFANKKLFEFLGIGSLEEFKTKSNCICGYFNNDDRYFNLTKKEEGKNWIDSILNLAPSKRVVSINDKQLKPHAFSVSINEYDEETYIITFTDISQTIEENIQLEEKVLHDKLTNAYNREYFERNYQKIIEEANKNDQDIAIALLDIDHFKSVNDTYGHDVGDKVLVEFVDTIQKYSRKEDILIRWGGEEFVLVLKVPSKDSLKIALENIRKSIENHNFDTVGQKTCSIGATIHKNQDIHQSIKKADECVYKAKESGRNRVVVE